MSEKDGGPCHTQTTYDLVCFELQHTRQVLDDLVQAVQTPRSGRVFFLALKAAVELLQKDRLARAPQQEPDLATKLHEWLDKQGVPRTAPCHDGSDDAVLWLTTRMRLFTTDRAVTGEGPYRISGSAASGGHGDDETRRTGDGHSR